MRSLEDIQNSILTQKKETDSLSPLEVLTTSEKNTLGNVTSASKVAIWRLWVFIVSYAIWLHERVFDAHKNEILELIAQNKIHTSKWYREQVLKFQLGFSLSELGTYDNENIDEAVVIASKIISQASVEEVADKLVVKVAKTSSDGKLNPLTAGEVDAFSQYMRLIKDAGTRLEIVSREADKLKLTIDIYFDPLVLDANGNRLDGEENDPVINAINYFLYNLRFNGEFLSDDFESHLKTVEGVQLVGLKTIQSKFGANNYADINETYIADAGYMELDLNELTINYVPRTTA